MTLKSLTQVLACWLAATVVVSAQTARSFLNDPSPAEPVITGAPYMADGTTTMKLTMFDGSHMERTITATVARDSAGRIRREQTITGLDPLDPASGGSVSVIIILDPVAKVIYTLMPVDKTAMRVPFPTTPPVAVPTPPVPAGVNIRDEPLGTKPIEGLTAVGKRTTVTVPAGVAGNEKPLESTDERWESVDLKVLVLTRYNDHRSADVEYKLTNIRRVEPPRELFQVPPDYKIRTMPPSRLQ